MRHPPVPGDDVSIWIPIGPTPDTVIDLQPVDIHDRLKKPVSALADWWFRDFFKFSSLANITPNDLIGLVIQSRSSSSPSAQTPVEICPSSLAEEIIGVLASSNSAETQKQTLTEFLTAKFSASPGASSSGVQAGSSRTALVREIEPTPEMTAQWQEFRRTNSAPEKIVHMQNLVAHLKSSDVPLGRFPSGFRNHCYRAKRVVKCIETCHSNDVGLFLQNHPNVNSKFKCDACMKC